MSALFDYLTFFKHCNSICQLYCGKPMCNKNCTIICNNIVKPCIDIVLRIGIQGCRWFI